MPEASQNSLAPQLGMPSGERWSPRVSIVIPHYNGTAKLRRCLESVLLTRYTNLEVVLADDCSTDTSVRETASRFPQVRICVTKRNLGFGGACNCGAREAKGEVLVFLNDDTQVPPDWMVPLLDCFRATGCGIATPKVLFLSSPDRINAVGGECDRWGFAWNRANGELDRGQYDRREPVFYGSACLAVRRAVWERIGGFDETYYMYHEDVDLCWRAQVAGFSVVYEPASVVLHDWQRARVDPDFVAGQIAENSFRSLVKNSQAGTLLYSIPVQLGLRAAEAAYFWRSNPRLSRRLLGGVRRNLRDARKLLAARGTVQRIRRVPDRIVRRHQHQGSLELESFLRRREHFGLAGLFAPGPPET